MSIIRTQLSGRQRGGRQSPLAVSRSSLTIKPSNSTYVSLSSTKLTDANHEISVKRSAQYNVWKTDRDGENTQNSLPYSTRVIHAEAHTSTWPRHSRLWHSIKDYYCAKCQIIAITGFRFIVLTHTPTHTYPHTHKHTSWQSDRNIRAAVLYHQQWEQTWPRYVSRFR